MSALSKASSKLVQTIHGPAVRRSKRVVTKRRASVIVNLGSRPQLVPCIIVDISPDGFRLHRQSGYYLTGRGIFHLASKTRIDLAAIRIPDFDELRSADNSTDAC